MIDPQFLDYRICEQCAFIFRIATPEYIKCARCETEFVRKFRESDISKLVEFVNGGAMPEFCADYLGLPHEPIVKAARPVSERNFCEST